MRDILIIDFLDRNGVWWLGHWAATIVESVVSCGLHPAFQRKVPRKQSRLGINELPF